MKIKRISENEENKNDDIEISSCVIDKKFVLKTFIYLYRRKL